MDIVDSIVMAGAAAAEAAAHLQASRGELAEAAIAAKEAVHA